MTAVLQMSLMRIECSLVALLFENRGANEELAGVFPCDGMQELMPFLCESKL